MTILLLKFGLAVLIILGLQLAVRSYRHAQAAKGKYLTPQNGESK